MYRFINLSLRRQAHRHALTRPQAAQAAQAARQAVCQATQATHPNLAGTRPSLAADLARPRPPPRSGPRKASRHLPSPPVTSRHAPGGASPDHQKQQKPFVFSMKNEIWGGASQPGSRHLPSRPVTCEVALPALAKCVRGSLAGTCEAAVRPVRRLAGTCEAAVRPVRRLEASRKSSGESSESSLRPVSKTAKRTSRSWRLRYG